MANKVEHALALAAKGFKVFPIQPGAKKPPLLTGWPKRATSDEAEIRSFWAAVPEANIGVHCAGFVVIDVDAKKGGDESLEALEITYGLPATLTVRTPTGGRHLYFRSKQSVPNSVATRLGKGLDVRSTGGYVVAPGSSVDAGTYEFECAETVPADAPEWLIDKLGPAAAPRAEPAAPVPPAAEAAVDRAREWLKTQPPAVEGQGGDAHTFKLACGLRDLGVSEAQALELLLPWDATCSPPWGVAALGIKVRNAYNYGQNDPGAKIATADDFPTVQVDSATPTKTPKVQRLGDFAAREQKGPGYVVKGLLQRRSYAELFGAPGEGKTFVALDISYHVAAGKNWMDRKVHAGSVLYLAYEGTGGLVKRAQALRQKYGTEDVPLYIAGAAFNLRDPIGRKELGAVIAQLPSKPVLIVIDTFARALMGGDENSAQDVGAFNSAIAALIESTGACVLIIHHSGKNKSAGARGSSALLGAIDTELEVDNHQVIARKQRDVETGDAIGFKLIPLVVGIDEDGDDLTSCVVEPAAVPTPAGRVSGNAKRGLQALCQVAPDNAKVSLDDWRTACAEFLGPRLRQGFYDLKKVLVQKGIVIEDSNGFVTRRLE